MAGISGVNAGDDIPVVLQLSDGNAGQFPQAVIRDNDNNLLATLDLSHIALGLYSVAVPYVMPAENYITITFIVYSDSGHTTVNEDYDRDIDSYLRVDPDAFKADVSLLALEATAQSVLEDTGELQVRQGEWLTAEGFSEPGEYDDQIGRLLGLTQENQHIDNTAYDCGKLTSGRLRTYSVPGSVGTDSDVIATYTITATYSGSDMLTYSMVKV